jgi:hypothetical protein
MLTAAVRKLCTRCLTQRRVLATGIPRACSLHVAKPDATRCAGSSGIIRQLCRTASPFSSRHASGLADITSGMVYADRGTYLDSQMDSWPTTAVAATCARGLCSKMCEPMGLLGTSQRRTLAWVTCSLFGTVPHSFYTDRLQEFMVMIIYDTIKRHMFTDDSEENAASIFRFEKQAEQATTKTRVERPICRLLGPVSESRDGGSRCSAKSANSSQRRSQGTARDQRSRCTWSEWARVPRRARNRRSPSGLKANVNAGAVLEALRPRVRDPMR